MLAVDCAASPATRAALQGEPFSHLPRTAAEEKKREQAERLAERERERQVPTGRDGIEPDAPRPALPSCVIDPLGCDVSLPAQEKRQLAEAAVAAQRASAGQAEQQRQEQEQAARAAQAAARQAAEARQAAAAAAEREFVVRQAERQRAFEEARARQQRLQAEEAAADEVGEVVGLECAAPRACVPI